MKKLVSDPMTMLLVVFIICVIILVVAFYYLIRYRRKGDERFDAFYVEKENSP